MFTYNEIYHLNSALDGEEIYGLNSMKNMNLNDEESIDVIKNLNDKRILNDDETLTLEGTKVIEKLSEYKNAQSYIWVNDSVMSLNNNSEYLIYMKETEDVNVEIKEITRLIMNLSIIKEYDFLTGNYEREPYKKYMDIKNFYKNILEHLDQNKVLHIREQLQEKISFYNIYFEIDNGLFKYDVIKKTFMSINPNEAREEISMLFLS